MKKILIIDDDRIFAKVLKDGLVLKRKEDYSVTTAADGEEGFALAQKEKPDLIVLDLVMPKLGGAEFLQKLRTDGDIANTPVIIGTQLSDMDEMSKLVELGVKGYIIKSESSLEQIIKQIDSAVGDTAAS